MESDIVFLKFSVLLLASCLSEQFGQIEGDQRTVGHTSTEDAGTFLFYYKHPKYPRDCKAVLDHCVIPSEESSGVVLVKPDCYKQPFEVYCDNYLDSDGWTNNEVYVNAACTEKCVCQGDQLICNSAYECSTNAACGIKDGMRQCYYNRDYEGDGETCSPLPKDCHELYRVGHTRNGAYTFFPAGWLESPFNVYCDMTTSGGGWTVFQRRIDGVTNFYRNWRYYKNGFGVLESGNDFWLGNEKLYSLTNTNQKSYKLRVDIVT